MVNRIQWGYEIGRFEIWKQSKCGLCEGQISNGADHSKTKKMADLV